MCLLGHNSLHINQNPAKLLLPFFLGGWSQFKAAVQKWCCTVYVLYRTKQIERV